MASVLVLVGPNKGELFPFDETASPEGVIIGRDPGCPVQLTDDRVSRHHARIYRDAAGSCRVTDLGSANGTAINGVEAEGSPALRDGDTIAVGGTLLRFSDRKLAHDARDYAGMQHIPRPREKFRDTQA